MESEFERSSDPELEVGRIMEWELSHCSVDPIDYE
jgi:hypothetical protein